MIDVIGRDAYERAIRALVPAKLDVMGVPLARRDGEVLVSWAGAQGVLPAKLVHGQVVMPDSQWDVPRRILPDQVSVMVLVDCDVHELARWASQALGVGAAW